MSLLSEAGYAPTFPTPGILAKRYPRFIHNLYERGVEIAVHGYHHVNLNDYSLEGAAKQLEKSLSVFRQQNIEVKGFRGPYTACREELINSLPIGMFEYSSNKTIYWSIPNEADIRSRTFSNRIKRIYSAKSSADKICVPWQLPNMVEIPICVPDDLQIHDGTKKKTGALNQAWQHMFRQIYQRGELFNLLFHTELAASNAQPLADLLSLARACRPAVWIAKLNEISGWWKEKSGFRADIQSNAAGAIINFTCTPRATILARGLGSFGERSEWDGGYFRLRTKTLTLPNNVRPFVGLSENTSARLVSLLREQGYIVEKGETAKSCSLYLDDSTLGRLDNETQLVKYIEESNSPLIRYGRWPDGAKSALSLSGDLDALSLVDYAGRLFLLR